MFVFKIPQALGNKSEEAAGMIWTFTRPVYKVCYELKGSWFAQFLLLWCCGKDSLYANKYGQIEVSEQKGKLGYLNDFK